MLRHILTAALVLACLASTPATAAQRGYSDARASDDLSSLSVRDRIRVIEREYAAQSGQRQIPDEQLEFYLDQVQTSRWTLDRIRADIIASRRGSNGGAWRPSTSGWTQLTVTCSSIDRRYAECRTPFNGRARILHQISDTRCIENNNWGQRRGLVWVNAGCRARFGEDASGDWGNDGNWGNGQRITCESRDGRYRECRTNFRGQARIHKKLSNASCNVGRDWGSRPGQVWVNNGCRAEFEDSRDNGPGNSDNYSVSCASQDGGYRTCQWDRRYGTPRLTSQQSNSPCIEGRTWGYEQRRGLWVDKGCRGRFGPK